MLVTYFAIIIQQKNGDGYIIFRFFNVLPFKKPISDKKSTLSCNLIRYNTFFLLPFILFEWKGGCIMHRILSLIAKVSLFAAAYSLNTHCTFIFYKHKIPDEVLQLKKDNV